MRCTSCEELLDQYLEGWLLPARAAAVSAHLRGCSSCETLHRGLRNVDGLLATATRPTLGGDFTGELMEQLAALPVPRRPARPLIPLAMLYLAGAWIVVIASLETWRGAASSVATYIRTAGSSFESLGQGVRAFWPAQPVVLLLVTTILFIDLLLLAAVVVFYRRVRPRLKAHLAAMEAR